MAASTVQYWLDAASRYPLLTARQEIELSRLVRAWLDHPDGPERAPTSVQRRGRRAKQRFVLSNLKLVVKVANKYTARAAGTVLSHEDLLQEGTLGLNRAAEKYDYSTGYKFSTYAFWWIQQAITRALEQQSTVIRLPNGPQQLLMKWRYRPHGQTLEEFAEERGLPADRVRKTLQLCEQAKGVASLDKQCRTEDDTGSSMVDFVVTDDINPLDAMDVQLAIEALAEACPADLAMLELAVVDQARFKDIAELNGHQSSRRAQREVEQAKARLELVAHMHYGRLRV